MIEITKMIKVPKDSYWIELIKEFHRVDTSYYNTLHDDYFKAWLFKEWTIKVTDDWKKGEPWRWDQRVYLEFQDDRKATEFLLRFGG